METENSRLLQARENDTVNVVVSKAPILSPIFEEVDAGLTYREIKNRYRGLADSHTKIYLDGEIVEDWDQPCNGGLVSIVQVPTGLDPFTIAIVAIAAAVIGAAIGYLMYEEPPEVPGSEKARRVRGDKNGNKGYEPLPFILGKRKVVPAYAANPYSEFVGNDQYYNMLLHIGYGPLKITDIKIGEVPISSFDPKDTQVAVLDWYENTDKNAIKEVWSQNVSQNAVNTELPRGDQFLTTNIPVGEGRTTVVIEYPQGLRRITSKPRHMDNAVQILYQGEDNTWYSPVTYITGSDNSFEVKGTIYTSYAGESEAIPYTVIKTPNGWRRAGFVGWDSRDKNAAAYTTISSSNIIYDDGAGFAVIRLPNADYRVASMRAGAKTGDAFTRSFTFDHLIHGNVANDAPVPLRVKNLSEGNNGSKPWIDTVNLLTVTRSEQIQENTFDDIIGLPRAGDDQNIRHAILAIRIRASDQLTGTLDDLNVMAESVTPSNLNSDWRYWWSNTSIRSTLTPTKNPAMLFKWVAQGPMNPVRVGNDRLDIDAITAWRNRCLLEGWEISSLNNYESTLKETLNNIARTGRAELSRKNGGVISVIENIERTVPAQIFTSKNSREFTSKRSFPPASDGITVEFQNENESFEVDEFTHYDPTIYNPDQGIDNRIGQTENLELWGVAKPELVQRHARFAFLEKRLRRETYTLVTDAEVLSCERGSFVKVASDVIDVGLGQGFIKSVNGQSFTIDETIGLIGGNTYALTIRSVDSGIQIQTITATYLGAGEWTTAATITFNEGDLVAYGEPGFEMLDCIVTNISYSNDFEATVTLVNAANEIYTMDEDTLPPYVTGVTPRPESFPPNPPIVTGSVGTASYGSPVIRIRVTNSGINTNVSAFKLQYRVEDEVYDPISGDPDEVDPREYNPFFDPNDPTSNVYIDVGVQSADNGVFDVPISSDNGYKYFFRAKAYGTGNLVSDWSDEYELIVSEQPADDVQSITLTELKDTPKTPNNDFSTIQVDIVPPTDVNYAYSILEYRVPKTGQDPQDDWFSVGRIGWKNDNQGEIVVAANGTTYEVRVRSVSIFGVVNAVGVSDQIVITNINDPTGPDYEPLPVPDVTGLELFGQASNTVFAGRDAKFVWEKSSYEDWAAGGATDSNLDLYFRDYLVEIYADNNLVRTETTVQNSYVYTYEMNAEDYARMNASDGAYRDFQIRVTQRGRNGEVSSNAATLSVSNNPPAPLQNLKVTAGSSVIEISYDRPADLDFAGVRIWISETQGFDPALTTPIATISDNSFVITGLTPETNYYVRLQPFDAFGLIGANYTSEFPVTTDAAVDLSGLSGWAYELDPVDLAFIEANMAGDAIPSTKIANLTAAKITTGTLQATSTITSMGVIRAVDDINNPNTQVGIGPALINSTSYLFWAYRDNDLKFGVDELGNVTVKGAVTIEGGSSGIANFSDSGTLATKDTADWSSDVTGTGKPQDNADVTSQNTANDTSNVNGVPSTTITTNLQTALDDAAFAQQTANGKITAYYQTTAPTGASEGDLWFDTDNGNLVKIYNNNAWVNVDDTRIAQAINDAQDAQTTADGKAETFFSTTTPTGASEGDLWYNTVNKTLKRYNGSTWDDVGTVGADWDSTLDNIPDRITDNATTGLNLTDAYLGFYNGTAFQSYIQSNGSFHFGSSSDNFIDYNGTNLVIDAGNFSVDASGNAVFSGDITGSNITGGAITGSVVTGSTIRTAASGERFEVNATANKAFFYDSYGLMEVAIGTDATGGYNPRAITVITGDSGLYVRSTGGSRFSPNGSTTETTLEVIGPPASGSNDSSFIQLGKQPTTSAGAIQISGLISGGVKRVDLGMTTSAASFGGNVSIYNGGELTVGGTITSLSNITAYSDIRLKTDLQTINNPLDKIACLNGYTYERTDIDGNERHTGLIAQEVLEVLPEAVSGGPTEDDPDAMYSLAYGNIVGLLVEGIKEERAKRMALEERLKLIEEKLGL